MKRRKLLKVPKTIQASLFATYSLVIAICLGIFVLSFYFWEGSVLRDRALSIMTETSFAVSEKLDEEVGTLDTVSLNILFSEEIRDQFFRFAQTSLNSAENVGLSREMNSTLFAIMGPNHLAQQVYLYDLNRMAIGTGLDNRARKIEWSELPWKDVVLEQKGVKYLSDPIAKPELAKFATSNRSATFISLCRVFPNQYNEPEGIVEVAQYYDDIFAKTDGLLDRLANIATIRVYNDRAVRIYPLEESDPRIDEYYLKMRAETSAPGLPRVNPISGVPEYVMSNRSDNTGWTTMTITDERLVMRPILDFTFWLGLLTLVVLLLALLLSFLAAKRITTPISHLRDAIKSVRLGKQEVVTSHPFTEFEEIHELKDTFDQMNSDVQISHQLLLNAKEQELHARMLALQSQMNPHFLYNVLSNIGAMAEDGFSEQIMEMCSSVSRMLRYISSDSIYETMEHEIEHVSDYLLTMQGRFGDKLQFSITVDESIGSAVVPKLAIQPLVENAIKYMTTALPPWNLTVEGRASGAGWEVRVLDSGPGFDAPKLQEVERRLNEIRTAGMLRNFGIEGTGVSNVFARLRLAYGADGTLVIESRQSNGACVTIGGRNSPRSESERGGFRP